MTTELSLDIERLENQELVNNIKSVLAERFPSFLYRPQQYEAIISTCYHLISGYSTIILDAPTGSGKSWIARQTAEVLNTLCDEHGLGDYSSLILTKTIALQNQYLNDFPEIRKLMGASNYDCHSDKSNGVNPLKKWHDGCIFTKQSGGCEYHQARMEYEHPPN